MKAKFFLAATLALALAVGSATASPVSFEASKTTPTMATGLHSNGKQPVKHHRHHKKHHRHHRVVKH